MPATGTTHDYGRPRRLTSMLLRVAAWRMSDVELVRFTGYLLDAEEHRGPDDALVVRAREAIGATYNAFTAGGPTGASIGASGVPTALGALIFILAPIPAEDAFGITGGAATFTAVQTVGVTALTLQCLLHPRLVRRSVTVLLVALPLVLSGLCFALFAPSTTEALATLAWTATRLSLLVIALGMTVVAFGLITRRHRTFARGWRLTGIGGIGVLVPDALWAALFASHDNPAWAIAFVLSAMGGYLMGNAMLHFQPSIAP